MIGTLDLRLRMALWLHRSWPFRLIAKVRMHRVPRQRGFDKFKPPSTGE